MAAPADARFEIREHDVDGVHVIAAAGGADLTAAVDLCERVDALIRSGCRRLLLDLSVLVDSDSSALRAIAYAATEFAIAGGRVAMVPPTGASRIGHETILQVRAAAEGIAALGSGR